MRTIVDAHHHLWDLKTNHYPWLSDQVIPRRFGDYAAIRRNYLPADLRADTQGVNLIKSVHVQANMAGDPVQETQWLQEQFTRHGLPHAIVAHADLSAEGAEEVLARHTAHANVRGIRLLLHWLNDVDYNGPMRAHVMREAGFRRGYALLAKYGLSFDLPLYFPQAGEAEELLLQHDDIPVVLNHCGFPIHLEQTGSARTESWTGWQQAIKRLARIPHLHCKISGLWMAGRSLTIADVRPIVSHCLDCFGIERCMFGSNFPLDGLHVRYADMVALYAECFDELSITEQNALFCDNATRFYRL